VQWHAFYDAMNGAHWSLCSGSRDSPCSSCNAGERFVRCAFAPGSGRALSSGVMQITHISLPSNNVTGTLPADAVFALFPALQLLNLSSTIAGPANHLSNQPCIPLALTCALTTCDFVSSTTSPLCPLETSAPLSEAPTASPGAAGNLSSGGGGGGLSGALVGGAIAGVLALIAVCGLCVFFVVPARRRRRKEDEARKRISRDLGLVPASALATDAFRDVALTHDDPAEEKQAEPAAKPVKAKPKAFMDRVLAMLVDHRAQIARELSAKIDFKSLSDYVLAHPVITEVLFDMDFRAFSSEAVLFWKAVDRFERFGDLDHTNPAQFAAMGNQIITEYVQRGARSQVPLSGQTVATLVKLRERYQKGQEHVFTREVFAEAKLEVALQMLTSFFAYFKQNHSMKAAEAVLLNAVSTLDDAKGEDDGVFLDPVHDVNTLMGLGYTRAEAIQALRNRKGVLELAALDLVNAQFESDDAKPA